MTQITIPSEPITVTYAAALSTTGPFIVPFSFLNQVDVIAIVTDALSVETVLVLTSGFTFTSLDFPVGQEGIGFTGGEITLVAPIGADGNSSIQILRSTVVDRTANFPQTGPFDMAILNDELNDHIAIMQELAAGQSGITNNDLQFVTDLGNQTTNNLRLNRGVAPLDVDFMEWGVGSTIGFFAGGGTIVSLDILSNLDFRIAGGEFHVLDSVASGGLTIIGDFGSNSVAISAIGVTDLDIGGFGVRWANVNMEIEVGGFFSVGVNGGNTMSLGEETSSFLCESPGFFRLRDDIGNNIQARVGTNAIAWTPNSANDWAWTLEDGMELRFEEKATALGNFANFGSIWVQNAAPNQLIFTDDAGTDHNLVALAGGITSGSFVGTMTGLTTSPTATFDWVKLTVGGYKLVWLTCRGGLDGVSNSVLCSVTGLPADITSTSSACRALGMALDNSFVSNRPCEFGIGIGGTLAMELQDSTIEMNADHFTASGNKGLGAGWNITYMLFQV